MNKMQRRAGGNYIRYSLLKSTCTMVAAARGGSAETLRDPCCIVRGGWSLMAIYVGSPL